jgi:hypothetical protein
MVLRAVQARSALDSLRLDKEAFLLTLYYDSRGLKETDGFLPKSTAPGQRADHHIWHSKKACKLCKDPACMGDCEQDTESGEESESEDETTPAPPVGKRKVAAALRAWVVGKVGALVEVTNRDTGKTMLVPKAVLDRLAEQDVSCRTPRESIDCSGSGSDADSYDASSEEEPSKTPRRKSKRKAPRKKKASLKSKKKASRKSKKKAPRKSKKKAPRKSKEKAPRKSKALRKSKTKVPLKIEQDHSVDDDCVFMVCKFFWFCSFT